MYLSTSQFAEAPSTDVRRVTDPAGGSDDKYSDKRTGTGGCRGIYVVVHFRETGMASCRKLV